MNNIQPLGFQKKSGGYFYFEGGVRYERNRLQRSPFVGEDEIFRYYCIDRSIRPGGKIAAFLPAPFQSRSFRDIISLHEKNEDTGRRKNAVAGISPGRLPAARDAVPCGRRTRRGSWQADAGMCRAALRRPEADGQRADGRLL